ncbi:MAG TPA: TlpA family protein disulfide reductase [Bacillus bacterium]|nr:TlpA family protein disulfide reductase [Bacillus sp. (in: firmicutes)]
MKLREAMPSFDGATTSLNGKISWDELIGSKPTLIHFWSISCPSCKEAMPNINQFRNQYKDKLNVVAVHMPRTEQDFDVREVKKVADEHKMTQPILIDNEHKITDRFGNKYVPAYYVFDKNGLLRHYQAGESGMKTLLNRINRVLDK